MNILKFTSLILKRCDFVIPTEVVLEALRILAFVSVVFSGFMTNSFSIKLLIGKVIVLSVVRIPSLALTVNFNSLPSTS